MKDSKVKKKFTIFLWFVGWENLALGLSINYRLPDLEIHLPFCFIRIGWEEDDGIPVANEDEVSWREHKLI